MKKTMNMMKQAGKARTVIGIVSVGVLLLPVSLKKVERMPAGFSSKSFLQTLGEQLNSFHFENTARASSNWTSSLANVLRNAIGQNVGYTQAGYIQFVCGGDTTMAAANCQGPPQSGITGAVASVVAQASVIAQSAGITSCSAIPSSGTATGKDSSGTSVTLTFGTPSHKIPSNWVNGGTTFQKRVKMNETVTIGTQSTAITLGVEFNCGSSSAIYAAINMPMSGNTGGQGVSGNGFTRAINIFSGPVSSTQNGFDVSFAETLPSGVTVGSVTGPLTRGASSLRVEYAPSTSLFNLYATLYAYPTTGSNGDFLGHTFMSGNYSTGQTSVYYSGVVTPVINDNNNDINVTTGATYSEWTNAAFGTASSFDFTTDLSSLAAGTVIQRQGCVNLASAATALTSNSYCAGMTPAAPTFAPAVDSAGTYSPSWLLSQTGMLGKMEITIQ